MINPAIPATVTQWRTTLGDAPDLEQIFERFVDPVHRYLYSRVGNREDAEDLTSEVFLKAARLLDRQRPEASLAQWLFTVARTVLADHWRRYYRHGALIQLDEARVAELQSETQDSEHAGDSVQRVNELLSQLSDRYRQVLELRFLRGYSIQETAAALDLSPENVKVIQHRALAKAVTLEGTRHE